MTVTEFALPKKDRIRGRQLVDEILRATDLDVTERYDYLPTRNVVRLFGDDVADRAADIQAIIDAHEPDPLYFAEDRARQRREGAEGNAAAIPGWATWTADESVAWIDANVTDLASAKQALRAMARMIVAMRDQMWPELERKR